MRKMTVAQQSFFAAVKSAFAFLVDQYGFSPPRWVNTESSFSVEFKSRRLLAVVLMEHPSGLLDFMVERPPTAWNRIWGYPDPQRKLWLSFSVNELAEALRLQDFKWRPWCPLQEGHELDDAVAALAGVVSSNFGQVLRGDLSLEQIRMRKNEQVSQ